MLEVLLIDWHLYGAFLALLTTQSALVNKPLLNIHSCFALLYILHSTLNLLVKFDTYLQKDCRLTSVCEIREKDGFSQSQVKVNFIVYYLLSLLYTVQYIER